MEGEVEGSELMCECVYGVWRRRIDGGGDVEESGGGGGKLEGGE